MIRSWGKAAAVFLALLLSVPLCLSCGTEGGKATIHIGMLTDFTGPASPAMKYITYITQDMVTYYNDENLIPEVKLKLDTYDTMYDPARVLPGYGWCKAHGDDVIITAMAADALVLKPFGEMDKVVIAAMGATPEAFEPPGWVLGFSSTCTWSDWTLLHWISENWDYSHGAPKVALIGWNNASALMNRDAVEDYLKNHPGEFDYVGSYVEPTGTMIFTAAALQIKDNGCDYVASISGAEAGAVLRDLRAAGSKARLVDCAQTIGGYRKNLVDMVGWETLYGSLSASNSLYWTDSSPIVDLAKELLQRYRPSEAKAIMEAGQGYVGPSYQLVPIFEVVQQAIQKVGAKNFNGQAFLDAALNYKTTSALWEGCPEFSFSQTKRWLMDYTTVLEFKADKQDFVTVTGWLPNVTE